MRPSSKRLTTAAIAAVLLAGSTARAEAPAREFTLVLAGGARGDQTSSTLAQLEVRLRSLDPAAGLVLFTGDYGAGELPEPGAPGRAEAERVLLSHVRAAQEFAARGGRVVFLAGERDFGAGGTRAVHRLRDFLNHAFEAATGTRVEVMPGAGCGEPTRIELTGELGLLLVDSQWWMEDWDPDPESNRGCEVKTREEFQVRMRAAFSDARTQRLIVATHHPLRSDGEYGGSFTAGAHLRPAPILGTLRVLASKAGLVPQFPNHPRMRGWLDAMWAESERFGSFVFVSGHDASLQLLHAGRQLQLISGASGASAEPTVTPADGDFAAAIPGWVELALGPTGGGEARFISGLAGGDVLHRAELPPLAAFAPAPLTPPAPMPSGPVIATYAKARGGNFGSLAKFFAGSFYEDAYALELPWEVLDLQAAQLAPFKTGGGLQTNVLRLHDPQGGDRAMRALTKDSSRFFVREPGAAEPTLDHAFTATHPEAALAVPVLAQAVGVLHPEPRLWFVPDQEGLGVWRGYLHDEVVALELRESEEHRSHSTEKVLEQLRSAPSKHRVDQEAWLRARLLDVLIGDWDRHPGQWRFVEQTADDGTKTYQPIPRDRDQAFSNYDGLGLALARISSPQARELQPFTGSYPSLDWLLFSARDLDPVFLNQVGRERWLAIAEEMKAALSDAVIDQAFSTWHREAWELDGKRIAAALKLRRDALVEAARGFFERLNAHPDVVGSTKDDVFELWFEGGGAVRVTVRTAEEDRPWFDRRFEPEQTRELRLYALEGDDRLVVHGIPDGQIGVRFVGGEGDDRVTAAASGSGRAPIQAHAIVLYDSEAGAQIDPSIEVRDERSAVARLNQYDRTENHEPDTGSFIPGLRTNPDEGITLGGAATLVLQGYKHSPFAARHELRAQFSTATLGAGLTWRGEFPRSAGVLDQQLEVRLDAPTQTRNFFGITNRTVDDGHPLDFFRVRQARFEARYGLSHGFGGDWTRVGAQVVGQERVTEATPGRFVTLSPDVTPAALGPRFFAGGRLFAETQTFDDRVLPRRGVGLRLSLEGRLDPLTGKPSANYQATAAAAIPFGWGERLVLVTRARVEGIVGEHPFYFAPTLGDSDLRAYHPQQLAGEVAFAQTTDLRIDVFRVATALPSSIGLTLSLDHGRVFGRSVPGNEYHLSYGGGVWFQMMNTLAGSVGYYRGLDGGSRFALMVGPLFAEPVL